MAVRAQRRAARICGAAIGLAALAAVVADNLPESRPPRLGAAVSVQVAAGGAIEARVPGGGPALAASSLRPGDPPLRGRAVLRNVGRAAMRVTLRPQAPLGARRGIPPAWRALALEAGPGGALARGTLADLHSSGRTPSSNRPGLVVPAGGRLSVPLRLWLAADRGSLAGERLSLVLVPVREEA